ncbi:unnamed protein product [Amoebophrya sp. A25]|nr:unnamed protein product [Amoebophrya sp. A25]|eukprot:GSA25T00020997001.1
MDRRGSNRCPVSNNPFENDYQEDFLDHRSEEEENNYLSKEEEEADRESPDGHREHHRSTNGEKDLRLSSSSKGEDIDIIKRRPVVLVASQKKKDNFRARTRTTTTRKYSLEGPEAVSAVDREGSSAIESTKRVINRVSKRGEPAAPARSTKRVIKRGGEPEEALSSCHESASPALARRVYNRPGYGEMNTSGNESGERRNLDGGGGRGEHRDRSGRRSTVGARSQRRSYPDEGKGPTTTSSTTTTTTRDHTHKQGKQMKGKDGMNKEGYYGNKEIHTGVIHDESSARLWVGGLPADITDRTLKEGFAPVAQVVAVAIKYPSNGPPFAFLQLETPKDAQRCVEEMNQSRAFGLPIKVSGTTVGGDKVALKGDAHKGKGRGGKGKSPTARD